MALFANAIALWLVMNAVHKMSGHNLSLMLTTKAYVGKAFMKNSLRKNTITLQ